MPAPHPASSVPVEPERGASATEYGLVVVAVAALIAAVVLALGGVVRDTFSQSCTKVQSGAKTTATCS